MLGWPYTSADISSKQGGGTVLLIKILYEGKTCLGKLLIEVGMTNIQGVPKMLEWVYTWSELVFLEI